LYAAKLQDARIHEEGKVRFQGCIHRTRTAKPVMASSEVRTLNPQVARGGYSTSHLRCPAACSTIRSLSMRKRWISSTNVC